MKKIISSILILLFSILIIAGCTLPNQDGLSNSDRNKTFEGGISGTTGSNTDNKNDDTLVDKKVDPNSETDSSKNQPSATENSGNSPSGGDSGKTTSDTSSIADLWGSISEGSFSGQPIESWQKNTDAWKEYLLKIIDNPDATIRADLNALTQAEEAGLMPSDEFYNLIVEKIRAKIDKTIKRTDLCQNDLLPLVEIAQAMDNSEDLAKEAISRLGAFTRVKDLTKGAEKLYPLVPQDCSSVEYKYEFVHENTNGWETKSSTKTTVSILGDLKEKVTTVWVNSNSRSYSWQRGTIAWWYNVESFDGGCVTIKKSSIGKADLTKMDGYTEINKDGTFEGTIIDKMIEVDVSETVQPSTPENDCSQYKPRSYTETETIRAYIRGTSSDKYNIVVSIDNKDFNEYFQNTETTFTSAKLHIPFPE